MKKKTQLNILLNSDSAAMEGNRRSGRLKFKGPVIEENTIDEAIDVEEYLREDENVSLDEDIENIIGTQFDKQDVGASSSGIKKVNYQKEGKIAKKRKVDTTGIKEDKKNNVK